MKQSRSGSIRGVNTSDSLYRRCRSLAPWGRREEESAYDAADFTNVADYVGPANVLAFGEGLGVERLFMQQMRSAESLRAPGASAEAFLEQALGCGMETFARLTGMALEKFQWAGATGVLFSSWRRVAETERVDLSLAEFIGVAGSYWARLGCQLWGGSVKSRR